jgi:hypothetical protein
MAQRPNPEAKAALHDIRSNIRRAGPTAMRNTGRPHLDEGKSALAAKALYQNYSRPGRYAQTPTGNCHSRL